MNDYISTIMDQNETQTSIQEHNIKHVSIALTFGLAGLFVYKYLFPSGSSNEDENIYEKALRMMKEKRDGMPQTKKQKSKTFLSRDEMDQFEERKEWREAIDRMSGFTDAYTRDPTYRDTLHSRYKEKKKIPTRVGKKQR